MINLSSLIKFIVNPRANFRTLVDNDDGKLLKRTDVLFLLYAVSNTSSVLIEQMSYNNTFWLVLILIAGVAIAYLFARHVFSYVFYKLAQLTTKKINFLQMRFIYSHALIPTIIVAPIYFLFIILVGNGFESKLIYQLRYLLEIITTIYTVYLFYIALDEIYKLKLKSILLITSPLIIMLIFSLN